MTKSGSLVVVGTGIKQVAQLTLEAKAHIEQADKVFYCVADPVTEAWVLDRQPNAESLQSFYAAGKARIKTYREMTGAILDAVRSGLNVCAVFYGHPGVFVHPSHESVRQARSEGFRAIMLPGVSAEDCIFADLDMDPSTVGCQQFEATHFLACARRPDPASVLILWQVGVLGDLSYNTKRGPEHERRIHVLESTLAKYYPSDAPAILYEAAQYAICEPRIVRTTVSHLAEHAMTGITTLIVPPCQKTAVSREAVRSLAVAIGAM